MIAHFNPDPIIVEFIAFAGGGRLNMLTASCFVDNVN